MGCRSCNLISELGCCSEAVCSLRSRLLTRWDCSWDPRGWGQGARQKASLAQFMEMLDGVWGCLDLRKAGAVIKW